MQRLIWLTNKDNSEKYEFSNFGKVIFTLPTNLGIYRNMEYLTISNQRINIHNEPSFNTITGTIIIRGLYSELEYEYDKLKNFVSKNIKTGFRLYVKVAENISEKYIHCDIEILDKSEKTSGTIVIPISIQPKSLWLGDVAGATIKQNVKLNGLFRFSENTIGQKKIYSTKFIRRENLIYTLNGVIRNVYSITFENSIKSQAFIYNSGEEETPLLIRVYGPANNPLVELKEFETGNLLQSVKFNNLNIPKGFYVEINSNPEESCILLIDSSNGDKIDVEDYASQNTTVYMKLPIGRYVIEASDDNTANTLDTRIFFTNQFKGV